MERSENPLLKSTTKFLLVSTIYESQDLHDTLKTFPDVVEFFNIARDIYFSQKFFPHHEGIDIWLATLTDKEITEVAALIVKGKFLQNAAYKPLKEFCDILWTIIRPIE